MISIIIVTYNAASTLQTCLDSIYNQPDKSAMRIIIIDGNSNDSTVSILKKNDDKIDYWISEEDEGIYDAMNKGVRQAKTDWIYFLGADDELLPDFSNFIKELRDTNTIYYANVVYKGAKQSGELSSYHQAKRGIFHQSIIYPHLVFKKYHYNNKYKIAADYALNLMLHKDLDFKFAYKDFAIAKYNDTGISSTVVDLAFERDKMGMIYENFNLIDWFRFLIRTIKTKI